MNTKHRRLLARFEAPSRFEAPVPFRGIELNALERLSERLLHLALERAVGAEDPVLVRRAANEAAALAATTTYPLLMFPELFEEKRRAARRYARRQAEVTEKSRALLAFAE